MTKTIPLSRPDITQLERNYVLDALASDTLSRGPMLQRFEQAFAQQVGRTATGVNSGTAALHLALRLSGVAAGDEVVVPPFTVAATINTVWQTGATPVFVDIDESTMALDPQAFERAISPRTKAVIPVHPFGSLADMNAITERAKHQQIIVIEDACEALGSATAKGAAGALGDFAAFGFYPNKQITTGEGGMLIGSTDALHRAQRLRNHGRTMDGNWLDQLEPGYNYRLPELSAAMGLAQLERLDQIMACRQRVANRYHDHLGSLDSLTLPKPPPYQTTTSWFAYVVRVAGGRDRRDKLAQLMSDQGIQCGRYFAPMHRQPAWRENVAEGQLPIADRVADSVLALPFYNQLEDSAIDRVCQVLADTLQRVP
ncbi:MAG: polysaccharide biosynthesis protein [Lysobacteraceae bacterium]|nr:MAG: polysaccharide biosynthesis protein [Xanthomonadaceae bacterium]